MKREFSAGGVVFNYQGQVLLIKNMAMRDQNKSYWGFPKGHLEKNEKSEMAARREIREETGIEVEIIQKLGNSQYVFVKDGEKIFKSVAIFLMRYLSGELKLQTSEIQAAIWLDPAEAERRLSFKEDIGWLKKALEEIDGQ